MTIHYLCRDCAMCEGVTESELEAKSKTDWHGKYAGHDTAYKVIA